MGRPRATIACVDLDTFFVSVERREDPSLIGKAVVVGGKPNQRGVVSAASYEVRELGVRSGMSLRDAGRLAPHAIFLPVRHGVYGEVSARVRTIVDRYSPAVQAASIDEFYVDFAGCERLYRSSQDADDEATVLRIVRELTAAIRDELDLPASAGIGSSRAVSKIACRFAKPEGVRLVPAGTEVDFLEPLPVRALPGIGPVAEERLRKKGFRTLGQLQRAGDDQLRRCFGDRAARIRATLLGELSDGLKRDRPAFREQDLDGETVGSISNERTFREDVRDEQSHRSMLAALVERVCWRARKRGVVARTVTLKLRYADFETLTRARTLPPTCTEREILPVIMELYTAARTRGTPLRLLGVALSKLEPRGEQQLGLFESLEVPKAVDKIRARFDYDAIRVASSKSSGAFQRKRPSRHEEADSA